MGINLHKYLQAKHEYLRMLGVLEENFQTETILMCFREYMPIM